MPLRVLVVEDYEPFRQYVCLMLEEADFQVVGLAADGLDAIQKAEGLQPDLILLDIGLPKLNGLQAATGMRDASPLSRILFLSQEFSSDIVETAFRLGARGYVHKLRAHTDLLRAIGAVLRGQYFVSGILNRRLSDVINGKSRLRHEVQFYSDDSVFLRSFTDFIAATLEDDKAAIVLASESHRAGILQGLKAQRLDVDGALEKGILMLLDVTGSLSGFSEVPDPARFFDVAGGLIEAAANAAKREQIPRVAICRGYPPLSLAGGKAAETLQLERLWDQIAHTSVTDILCGYALAGFEKDNDILQAICSNHSTIYSW